MLLISCAVFANANEIDAELDIAESFMHTDTQSAIDKLNSVLSHEAELSSSQKSRLYMLISLKHLYVAEYKEADIALERALSFNPPDDILTRIYLYKVTVNIGLKDYKQAFTQLEINLARIHNYQDNSIKIATYNRLLNVYLELEAYDEMLRISRLALDLNQGKNPKNQCYSMLYYSVAHLRLKKLQQASSLFSDTEEYCAEQGFPLIAVMSVKGRAIVAYENEDYQQAETLLLTSLDGYQKFKFEVEINEIHSYLGMTYFYLGRFQQAKLFADKVNQLPIAPNNLLVKKRVNEALSLVAGKQGQFDKAYQYQVVANALSLQILNEQKVKENAYQMARFDSVEKNRETNSLMQDHELLVQQKDLFMKDKSSSIMFSTLLVGVSVGLLLLLISAWLQRNQFMKQAQRDGLTGIYNRRTGQELAENEFIEAQTINEPFSVLLMDLDLFKNINDQFGHATGDWTLKKVTSVIETIIRPNDIFTRMGGEEFAIFMPKLEQPAAEEFAERIRIELMGINTRYSGHEFTITVSCGVSTANKDDLSLDPLIQRADLALYSAKNNGRNCVVCYNELMSQPTRSFSN
ncbi:tetratricopeptide repeat-containing diguanylate cyclase [Shewanella ulleungensis]|uniref:tetratricopeptide repeat-containing diguanylate cyclase n=1 Tax=Shewanella ulleungensis TaxID=2282699 RepID=UPI00166A14DC|nr:GGDEF domain-containing protein [Shewanella ulleungensis]MCL1149751.1 GGDEF domain-containing protein [Shewanella ulleungensis]